MGLGCACPAETAVCALKLFHDFWKEGPSFAWPAETSESGRILSATLRCLCVTCFWFGFQFTSLLCPISLDLGTCGGEMLMHVLTFWIWSSAPFQSLLLFGNNMCGRKQTNKKQHSTKQKFYMVEVAVEFFLTHCIAVTWVEHACKNSQLHMLLSCRKAGCRIN